VISDQLMRLMEKTINHPFYVTHTDPVILGVGRLEEQKDFASLINAFSLVHERIPARLVILGEGQDRHALQALIDSLGLQEWIDLPGFDINPFAFMKRSAVFVLSSKWEGLPNALIQALTCGCPVVSTDCLSGPAEILNDGEYGHLVPVGDAQALAEAILAVLQGSTRKPPQNWLNQFKPETIIPQYLTILCV